MPGFVLWLSVLIGWQGAQEIRSSRTDVARALRSGCTELRGSSALVAGSIGLVYDPGNVPERIVSGAIEAWEQCSNYSQDFPKFLDGEAGDQVLQVEYNSGSSGDDRCGEIQGRKVVLFRFAQDSKGQRVACGARDLNLAHEMGHALGLRDSSRTHVCDGGLMARLTKRNRFDRRVTAEECSLVGQRWLTFSEVDRDSEGIIHRLDTTVLGPGVARDLIGEEKDELIPKLP